MITFLTPLDCRALDKTEDPTGSKWRLLGDLVVLIGHPDSGEKIVIPAGFVTDFGSVPPFIRLFVNPQGIAKPAYVLHDWLYKEQDTNELVADAMLNDAMESLGVSWIQRVLVYRGLRLGGWWAWNEHSRENAKAQVKAASGPEGAPPAS